MEDNQDNYGLRNKRDKGINEKLRQKHVLPLFLRIRDKKAKSGGTRLFNLSRLNFSPEPNMVVVLFLCYFSRCNLPLSKISHSKHSVKDKQKINFLIVILFIIFELKNIISPCTFNIFYISPCTLVLVHELLLFFLKKHSMKLLCFIIVLFIIFIENNHKIIKKKFFFKKNSFHFF